MRGGFTNNFEMMSSTCVQNVGGGIPHNLGGGGYESPHIIEARTPAPAWHHMNTTASNLNATLSVKPEPIDHDSSAYGSGSDGFHSSSPGGSDHSRDSNPPSIPPYSTAHLNNMHMAPFYTSTPLVNHIPVSTPMQISYHQQMQQIHQQQQQIHQHQPQQIHQQQPQPIQQQSQPIHQQQPLQIHQQQPSHNGFNPLTPPSFEPMVSPKNPTPPNQEVPQVETNYQQIETDPNTTLTPCTTPPSEATPPKSPKNTHSEEEDSSYFSKTDGEDHLRRLQMAFERSEMLPESPKGSENRDSADEDCKSDYEMDEVDEQGLRIPRVNSHGKVKVFKCKQCEFVAVTKLDFWEHSRGHIKAEKLLTCPKCPFVTEYKHHLEYHLRNHFGSKPFKCDKCSYSCVNKSMLNSHLKSHSNIYQYRCSDCTYATKYCHSLKLHLRKYKHNPAMVLNPDGTPNPLPIIDVYGTRRGPKQKNGKGENETITTPNMENSPPMHPGMPPHALFPHFMMNAPQSGGMSLPFPYGSMLAAFPGALNNPLLFPHMNPGSVSPNPSNGRSTPESLKIDENSTEIDPNEDNEKQEESPNQPEDFSIALDLSKPEISLPINVPAVPVQTPIAPVNPAKNRRKGRAFKLERISPSKEYGSDDEDFLKDKSEEKVEDPVKKVPEPPKVNNNESKKSDTFNCQYCDIAFRDVVMYTMHMGYHGYKDPFTCNMCGEQSADKLSFFLHIARTSHS